MKDVRDRTTIALRGVVVVDFQRYRGLLRYDLPGISLGKLRPVRLTTYSTDFCPPKRVSLIGERSPQTVVPHALFSGKQVARVVMRQSRLTLLRPVARDHHRAVQCGRGAKRRRSKQAAEGQRDGRGCDSRTIVSAARTRLCHERQRENMAARGLLCHIGLRPGPKNKIWQHHCSGDEHTVTC